MKKRNQIDPGNYAKPPRPFEAYPSREKLLLPIQSKQGELAILTNKTRTQKNTNQIPNTEKSLVRNYYRAVNDNKVPVSLQSRELANSKPENDKKKK